MPVDIQYDCLSEEDLGLASEPRTHSEELALTLERDIRNEYLNFANRIVHRLEPIRAKWTSRSMAAEISRIRSFASRTKTVLRNKKIIHLSEVFATLNPGLVYEFGAGASTVFMGYLMKRQLEMTGQSGKIIAFEQSPEYHRLLVSELPDEVSRFVEFRLCPVRLTKMGAFRAMYYDVAKYDPVVDFVFVDGPAPPSNHNKDLPYRNFSGDLPRMIEHGTKVTSAATDVRWFNFGFYSDVLGHYFDVQKNLRLKSVVLNKKAK